jgi:hypothetical protein
VRGELAEIPQRRYHFPGQAVVPDTKYKEIHISRSELSIAAMGIFSLSGAALVEAF